MQNNPDQKYKLLNIKSQIPKLLSCTKPVFNKLVKKFYIVLAKRKPASLLR